MESIKNKICYFNANRGTVVSEAIFDEAGNQSLCNVIWDDGQHCTEPIEMLEITNEVNANPPSWS